MITKAALLEAMPQATFGNIDLYQPWLDKYAPEYGIDTPARVAGFIAQVAVESMQMSRVVENLNYSSVGLARTFAHHFIVPEFVTFANQPERIANRVYAHRLGNGSEESGDGWRFRGRGLIQITGRGNYGWYSRDNYKDDRIVDKPELLAQPDDAVRSAMWYWKTHGLNPFADAGDIRNMTLKVNGGMNGFDERKVFYARACKAFGFFHG